MIFTPYIASFIKLYVIFISNNSLTNLREIVSKAKKIEIKKERIIKFAPKVCGYTLNIECFNDGTTKILV